MDIKPFKLGSGDSLKGFWYYANHLYYEGDFEDFKTFVRINKWWYDRLSEACKNELVRKLKYKSKMKNEFKMTGTVLWIDKEAVAVVPDTQRDYIIMYCDNEVTNLQKNDRITATGKIITQPEGTAWLSVKKMEVLKDETV